MRVKPSKVLLLLIVFALALGPLFACGVDPHYSFDDGPNDRLETETGANLKLGAKVAYPKTNGCACKGRDEGYNYESVTDADYSVEPADGASVTSDGVFTATRPGTYTVRVSGKHGSATTKVVVDDSGEATVEEPVETTPAEDPLVGDWTWTGAMETNGVLGPSSSVYTYTFRQEGGGYAIYVKDTRLCGVTFDGKNVSFSGSLMGAYEYNGVLSGDMITGTQNHEGGRWVGPWSATRVQ